MKAKELEKEYDKIRKKFILDKRETEIWLFFQEIKCCICNHIPNSINKNHKIGKEYYCTDCYNKIKGFRKYKEKIKGDEE